MAKQILYIARRYPVQSYFKYLESKSCPYCGAPLHVHVASIERKEDDRLTVVFEEYCSNESCKYDKIVEVEFFPELVELYRGE